MDKLTDTSPEAEKVLREAQRRMPFARRWRQMGELYRQGKVLHAMGYRDRHPGATAEEIAADWREHTLSQGTVPTGRVLTMDDSQESQAVLEAVIAVLEELNIFYAVGGSWASSLHGERRFTHDADLSVEPFPGREAALTARFGEDYYVSLQAVQEAVQRRSSFNIIHLPSSFKVDIFVCKDRLFETIALHRRRSHSFSETPGTFVFVLTPEDIILYKLEWFRIGGEVSERQWNDILGVFKVQGERLDQAYLDRWARAITVEDLLARAREESAV